MNSEDLRERGGIVYGKQNRCNLGDFGSHIALQMPNISLSRAALQKTKMLV